MKNYWQNAITFDEYLKVAEDRFHNNPNKEDEYQEYYELGLQRTNRTVKTFKIDECSAQNLRILRVNY